MKREDARKARGMPQGDETFFDDEVVASATECTGLMPALPRTAEEGEDIAALYAVHSAKKPGEKYKTR